MDEDLIATVEIDAEHRLHVVPATRDFPYVYREGMEVSWSSARRSLHSPEPREWTYGRWFQQIVAAAAAQGVRLSLGPATRWVGVPPELQVELCQLSGQDA